MKKLLIILITALFSAYLLTGNSIFAASEEEDLWNSIFNEIANEQDSSSSSSAAPSGGETALEDLMDSQSSDSSLDTSVEYNYDDKNLDEVTNDFFKVLDSAETASSSSSSKSVVRKPVISNTSTIKPSTTSPKSSQPKPAQAETKKMDGELVGKIKAGLGVQYYFLVLMFGIFGYVVYRKRNTK